MFFDIIGISRCCIRRKKVATFWHPWHISNGRAKMFQRWMGLMVDALGEVPSSLCSNRPHLSFFIYSFHLFCISCFIKREFTSNLKKKVFGKHETYHGVQSFHSWTPKSRFKGKVNWVLFFFFSFCLRTLWFQKGHCNVCYISMCIQKEICHCDMCISLLSIIIIEINHTKLWCPVCPWSPVWSS